MRLHFKAWLGALLGVGMAFPAFRAAAEKYDYQQENRFLIVVETASAMKRCSNAVSQIVGDLIESEMKGELRRRDTIGVWTYNDLLYTEFPMQVWKETNTARIERNILRYLGEQRYEKKPHLEKILPVIGQVIGVSERVTVIFVFDGAQDFKGTPFDAEINAAHKKFRAEFKSKNMPFVTAISARYGKIIDYMVSAPGSMKLPHLATPYVPEVTNTPPPVVVAPPPAPHKYVEIVMAGAPRPAAVPTETNAEATPAPVPSGSTAPVASVAPGNDAAVPAISNLVVQAQAPVELTPAANAVAQTNVVEASVTNGTTNAPVATAPASTPPATPWTRPNQLAPDVAAAAVPVSQPAPASLRENGEEIALYVIASSLAAIALSLIWFLARKTRAASASLISQSMDRSR